MNINPKHTQDLISSHPTIPNKCSNEQTRAYWPNSGHFMPWQPCNQTLKYYGKNILAAEKFSLPVGGEERRGCRLGSTRTNISLLLPKNLLLEHLFQILEKKEQ